MGKLKELTIHLYFVIVRNKATSIHLRLLRCGRNDDAYPAE